MFAGIIPFLLSLFGTAGGAAAAGTAAAETVPAAAGAGSGLLGGLFGSGSSGSLGGLLSLFGGGASAGPQQLSGPGMEGVTGAVGPGNGPQPAGASGGFNLGSLLGGGTMPGGGSGIQPAGQNMMADLMGGIGRAYMQGALAGKGDFKGAAGLQAQHEQSMNQTARTGILQQESTQRQEQLDIQKAQQAKVDAANAKIAGIFENPKALEDITQTMGSILPHLLQAGDHAGAAAVVNLLSKAATDKKTSVALSNATAIAGANRAPDGSYDFGKIQEGIQGLNDPNVSEVYDKVLHPRLIAESNVVNQKGIRQEAATREDQANKRLDISERNADLRERMTNASINNMAATQDRLGRALEMKQGLGPVPPAQLPQYINKNGGNPQQDPALNQGNPTHGDLVQSGYARVPQPVQVQLKQSNIALTQLDRLQGLTDELFKGVTPGKNLLNAAKLKGQEVTASGKVREFQTLLLETIPSMAVASGLTPGRVGETVLEKIEKPMMPNLTDTQDTVNGKLKQLKQRLENNREVFFGQGAKMGGASAVKRAMSKSGKPMISEDDGKTWKYE